MQSPFGLTDLTGSGANTYETQPKFSPDGTEIVYSGPHHARGSVGADLWIMNLSSRAVRELDHESNGYSDGAFPAWSPDGRMIAFTANNGSGFYHVWSVPPAGGENTALISNTLAGGNPLDEQLDWQPLAVGPQPRTVITSQRIGRRGMVTLAFQATGPATGYRCRLRGPRRSVRYSACHSPQVHRGLKPGWYTFEVVASAPGERYGSPAKRRFRVH